MKIDNSNIKIKEKNIFNVFAKSYFNSLNKNFKATKNWQKFFLANLLKDKNNIVYWINENNTKVGFIIIKKVLNTFTKKRKLKIIDFYILKKYQNKQFGSTIFKKIILFAKKRKISKIEIEVLINNKNALRFWKKFKFKKKSIKLSLNI